MTQAADKQSKEADAGASARWRLGPAIDVPTGRSDASPYDEAEEIARRRARRQALFLMIASGAVAIALIAGAWLLLRWFL